MKRHLSYMKFIAFIAISGFSSSITFGCVQLPKEKDPPIIILPPPKMPPPKPHPGRPFLMRLECVESGLSK